MRTDQVLFFSFLSWTLCSQLCSAGDTLNAGEKITQDSAGNLVSSNLTFELGFFPLPTESGNSSEKRYLGIWYHGLEPQTVVWVANRDKPVLDSSGVFRIAEDGNLVVEGASGSHWSSELEGSSSFTNRTVKLLDSGNLVLMDDNLGASYLWQSFQNPTDTFLPGMKMDPSLTLTSWKDATDPARGSFTFKLDQGAEGRRFVVQNQSQIYWALDELDTEAMYPVIVGLLDNATRGIISDKRNGTIYPSRSYSYNKSRLLMNASGEIQFLKWMEEDSRWDKQWSGPGDKCDRQDYCGSFGICNKNNQIRCKCLPGFSPRNSQYPAEIQGQGCVRKSKSCIDKDNVMFLNFTRIKVGDPDGEFVRIETEAECQSLCLNGNKCPESLCQAYSYSTSTYDRGSIITCKIWTRNLSNLIEEYDRGLDLSILVKRSDLDGASTRIQESLYESERQVKDMIGLGSLEEKDIEGIEVPCYTFASILAATDNFSDSNKLGRGGYGPVYKGTFPGGQDIAVKRLSSISTQGLQEFKNEVILIAKLQHRNLVRLRGYCIKGDEKILLYEYMPNKSLDSFIFDGTRTLLLDWPMRFEIILGIARGLLYLHQDSRLRVIHRDMKTSNILLDEEMNPKISDFGLAKIFGGKETEASTERVVGTYGYMAPEYALDGHFSIKSDVFSFGVVLLEILSGKKNTGFYQSKQISSLLGYAWKSWTENKLLDLMDPSLGETCNENQFIRCAHIGLLCIQDEPGERPTMSNVLSMLDIETATMPIPTQPTFFVNKHLFSSASSSSKPEMSMQFESSYQDGR